MEAGAPLKTRAFNAARRLLKWRGLEPLVTRLADGATVSSWRGRLPPNHYQYELGTMRTVGTDDGLAFIVDIGTLHGWYLYFGLRDPSLEVLYSLVHPGMHVYDIGANDGVVSLRLASRVGELGEVAAFEPFPETWDQLLENLRMNPGHRVTPVNVALGASAGTVRMEVPDARNAGRNRMSADPADDSNPPVPIARLDDYVDEHCPPRLDVVKIDVEGYEGEVLRGATRTLARFGPTIFLELDDQLLRRQGDSIGDVLALLDRHGYEVSRALTGTPLIGTEDFSGQHFDGVACRIR